MTPSSMRHVALLLVTASACLRELEVPPAPDPARPGTVQGSLVFAQVGLSTLQVARGATIELVGAGVSTTSDASGRFNLRPISANTGAILIRFDADQDGVVDRQRVFSLEDIEAGPGRDIALGQIRLGDNATVRGSVLRTDLSTLSAGHGGTAVFVPEGPFTIYSGDNGSFTLENLPEGRITLAFFRPGYVSSVSNIELRAGEVFSLATVLLTPQPTTPAPARVTGFALLAGGASHEGVAVSISGLGVTTHSDAAGRYVFPQVPRGIYSVGFEKDGFRSAVLTNVLIDEDEVELRAVALVPGASTPPDLDGGILPFDAGSVPDAGPPDAGGGDSGVPDAGSPDAGSPDAGSQDAGDGDAGKSDAGADGGSPPVAIIDPPPSFVMPSQQFTLNAQSSTGTRPLSYSWRQDAGTTVTIPNNNSVLAATPTIQAPSSAQVLHFGLTVTDAIGRTSVPAEVTIAVSGTAPQARIAAGYPTTAYAGQHLILDGSGSFDTGGSGIASYSWVVSPSSIGTIPRNGGAQLELVMPTSVPTPLVITAQLTVTNGLGVPSTNNATASITLTTASAPVWYVDAGTALVVNGGAQVTLNGTAVTPGLSGVTFTYVWAPDRAPGGGVPDWQLSNPLTPITQFVAPIIVGPTRRLDFTLTATAGSGSGLMPMQNTGSTYVMVQDRTPPQVVATSIDAMGYAGAFGVWAELDEAIDPASVNSVTVTVPTGAAYGAPTVNQRIVDGKRITLVLRPMAVPGNAYNLVVQSVRDQAPVMNTMPSAQVFPFIAANPWSPPYESVQSSTAEPRPGLVVRAPPGGPSTAIEALVFGRKETQPWVLAPFNPLACTAAPCPLVDDTSQPAAGLMPQAPRGKRGALWGSTAVATMQVRDYAGDAGVAFLKSGASGWAPLASPPGQMFSYGGALYSAYAESGLKIAVYDSALQAWNLADAGTISSNATDFPSDSASDPLVQAGGHPNGDLMLVARTSKTGQLRSFRWTPGSAWQAFGSYATSGSPATDVKIAPLAGYSGSAWFGYTRANSVLDLVLYGDVNNGSTGFIPSGASGFDIFSANNFLWIVVSVNGQIQLHYQVLGSGTFQPYPGPLRGGMPSNNLNNDPSCFADHPELAPLADKLFISWEERCGTGPWRIYLRSLN